ncbi:hypothetical protein C1N60_02550 [Pantoea sp. SGAir0184]
MGNTPERDASSGVVLFIGNVARLDLTSRSLIRLDNSNVASLSASASRCLCSFVDSVHQVLSPERLIEDGWRSQGLEATENSVRVMISQLRRAIASLNLQHEITIQTVSGEGYMMLIRQKEAGAQPGVPLSETEPQKATPSPAGAQMSLSKSSTPNPSHFQAPDRPHTLRFWYPRGMALFAGALIGIGCAKWIVSSFLFMPASYYYTEWQGTAPPGKSVWIAGGNLSDDLVSETLSIFSQYASDDSSRPYLYINDGFKEQYLSLFACRKPVTESENGCEAFFFRKS